MRAILFMPVLPGLGADIVPCTATIVNEQSRRIWRFFG